MVSGRAWHLKRMVESRVAAEASLIQTVPVRVGGQGGEPCDVDVHVFALSHCRLTGTAYAWTAGGREFTALDIGPIRSPTDAVCAVRAEQVRLRNLASMGAGAA
ncbi:MAG: hypothetical protein KIT25_05155 [Enhydrobacter sp.]|nr:MAG: hypothetical protein KIT25_05155 [Enhydrobacter sp.]